MQFNEIPLSPDNQQFRVLLGSTTYTLRIIWRDAAGWIIFRLCEERIEQLIERLVCEFNERGPEMRALLRRFMLTGG